MKLISEVFAQENTVNLNPPIGWDLPSNVNISTIIGSGLQLLLLIAAVFFFVYLIIGGIKWIMSGGDKAKVEAARNQITHALIGLLVVFGSWIIVSLVKTMFGIDIFNPPIPSFKNAVSGGGGATATPTWPPGLMP